MVEQIAYKPATRALAPSVGPGTGWSVHHAVRYAIVFILALGHAANGHMGAKFEPPDGTVLHGLGQYVPLFYTDAENWQYVEEYEAAVGEIPFLYAAYRPIEPVAVAMDPTDLTDIVTGHCHPYALLLGIYFIDANQDPIDVSVLTSGAWDAQIIALANEVASLGVPCFVRPGFEFGAADGFHGAISGPDFVTAWHYVQGVFEDNDVDNVAWVWNTVNPWTFNYMDYYPGDEAVDWWGINYFTTGQMSGSDPFVLDAAAHGKPVIICESSPIHNDGTDNAANWNAWFVPYFNKIAEHAHLKAFVYISDPWDRPGAWDWWDNSRIDANEYIRSNYASMLDSSTYISQRPGDVDHDDDVDESDQLIFASCYSGPEGTRPAECHPMHYTAVDLDCDDDVDCGDYALFTSAWTATPPAPTLPACAAETPAHSLAGLIAMSAACAAGGVVLLERRHRNRQAAHTKPRMFDHAQTR